MIHIVLGFIWKLNQIKHLGRRAVGVFATSTRAANKVVSNLNQTADMSIYDWQTTVNLPPVTQIHKN